MSSTDSNPTPVDPIGDAFPNQPLAAGLRELADFLDANPELPGVRAVAWISDFRYSAEDRARARPELAALAAALGDRATEIQTGSTVRIEGMFGPIVLHADANVHELAGDPKPAPAYDPIIPVSPSEDEAWRELETRR